MKSQVARPAVARRCRWDSTRIRSWFGRGCGQPTVNAVLKIVNPSVVVAVDCRAPIVQPGGGVFYDLVVLLIEVNVHRCSKLRLLLRGYEMTRAGALKLPVERGAGFHDQRLDSIQGETLRWKRLVYVV